MSRNALRLVLILVLLEAGLALRVVSVDDSILDALSRQQAATALRARSIHRHGVDRGPEGPVWRGTGGRPRQGIGFVPRTVAWLYGLRGYEWPRAGRILSALAGVLAAVILGASFSGEGVEGRAAVPAVLLLLSPVSVFLGRSFVPDSLLLLLAAALTWAMRRVLHGRADGTSLLVAMVALGAGLLASPVTLFWSLPVAWVLVRSPRAREGGMGTWRVAFALLLLFALSLQIGQGWLSPPDRVDGAALLRGRAWADFAEALLVGPWTAAGALLVVAGLFVRGAEDGDACLGRIWMLAALLSALVWFGSASAPDALGAWVVPGAVCAAVGWTRMARRRGPGTRRLVAAALLALAVLTGRGPVETWSRRPWGLWQVEEAAHRLAACTTVGEQVLTSYLGGAELLYLADRPGRHVIPDELDGERIRAERARGVDALALLVTVPPERIPSFRDPARMNAWIESHEVPGNRCDAQGQGGYFVRRLDGDDPFVGAETLVRGNVAGRIFSTFRRLLEGPEDWDEIRRSLDVDVFVLTYPVALSGEDARLHRHLHDSPDWGLVHWTDHHLLYLPRRGSFLRHHGRSRLDPLRFDESLRKAAEERAVGDLLAELDEKRRREGASPRVAFLRGCTLAAMGRTIEARLAFEEAIELDPSLGDAWNNLAAISVHAGDRARAAECLRRAHALGYPVDRRFAEELGLEELVRKSPRKRP